MPRYGASMLLGSISATYYLQTAVSVNSPSIIPVLASAEEITKFTEVRNIIAETMSRIIRRDQDTNGILGGIAQGRGLLAELAANN